MTHRRRNVACQYMFRALLSSRAFFYLCGAVQPAAALAEEGFAVGPVTAELWRQGEAQLRQSANCAELLVEGGGGGGGRPGGDGGGGGVIGELRTPSAGEVRIS